MATLLSQLRTPTILNYIRRLPQPPYMGEILFPRRDVSELAYKYVVGANNLPVMATVIPFNSEAPIHSRDSGEFVTGAIPAIKRKIMLDETTMFKLLSPRPQTNEFDDAIREIFDDVRLMTESVNAKIEYMRMEALTTGAVVLAEEGVKLTADFGVPTAQKVVQDNSGATLYRWDHASAAILDDLKRWADIVEVASGVRPTRAVTSRRVVNTMLNDANIRDAFWNRQNSRAPVTFQQVNQLLGTMDLPQIATYEARARVETSAGVRSTVRMFPDHKFVMLPPDKLGDTLYAPTVEALRAVRNGVINFGDARGIYGEIWEENEPPAHWTKAASLAFPTFPRANEVLIADVLAAA